MVEVTPMTNSISVRNGLKIENLGELEKLSSDFVSPCQYNIPLLGFHPVTS